ncbi:MAG: DEAD/DEAH box helicase family protein [Methanomicrobiaceae archaeon]|nr:DEAD/DEAH box helicase family protein [Methanomicrobiaceae archaeon]
MSEREICTKYITPAIINAGWDLHSQIREEVNLTKGQFLVRGGVPKRGKRTFADYVLYHKSNVPIAIVEAKDNNHCVGHGMQQALEYADMIDVPFVFSSNGDAFLMHDKTVSSDIETEISLDKFPGPSVLWEKYRLWKGFSDNAVSLYTKDYYVDASGKSPRYYQVNAINKTIEAITKGQDRILLAMATGTGKTYTAFQIIWRLWKSGAKKRILFLADRNILVDQTRTNDFKPFGNAMTKIKNRTVDKSFEIYLGLYQALTGEEESKKIFKEFSPDFFDLIVIDECHRGSAADDSAWREILDHFQSATHIGLTATPKETKYVSNINYFGNPVYTYSLKQGIEDGFLAPFRVFRIDIDKDICGWRPDAGKTDRYGNEIEDRIYDQKDFDRELVLEKRTELVAGRIADFMRKTDPYGKTIVFCEDIDHAERMRQSLVNALPEYSQKSKRYVMRITGDSEDGKAELDNFIMPEERYPVIATTSKLLTTGVDVQTCKLIVIDKRITSMTEFKQIIGRGTRINEEFGKKFFTIMDFRKATELFSDPDWDGPALPDEDFDPDREHKPRGKTEESDGRTRYFVNDVEVSVVAERVQYYSADGKLVTESLKDFTKTAVAKDYPTLDEFLNHWTDAERKSVVVAELEEKGVLIDALKEQVGFEYDPFDLICHVVFDRPPMSRKERAGKVRKQSYFDRFGKEARAVLDAILDKYSDEGLLDIESMEILRVTPISSFGTPIEIINGIFGGRDNYLKAIKGLETCLYSAEC